MHNKILPHNFQHMIRLLFDSPNNLFIKKNLSNLPHLLIYHSTLYLSGITHHYLKNLKFIRCSNFPVAKIIHPLRSDSLFTNPPLNLQTLPIWQITRQLHIRILEILDHFHIISNNPPSPLTESFPPFSNTISFDLAALTTKYHIP